jgi:hypothetical protein
MRLREGNNALADRTRPHHGHRAGDVDPGHEWRVRDVLVGGERAAAAKDVDHADGSVRVVL